MYNLFNPAPQFPIDLIKNQNLLNKNLLEKVSGLRYIPDFITKDEEDYLVANINDTVWLTDIRRRVQHYGYKYDYKARSVDYSMYLGPLPEWINMFGKRLFDMRLIDVLPDQAIVNEYLPGQGIANHIDCEPCFGDTIISLSLSSPCVMDFISLKTKDRIELILEPRSVVVVSGEARHKWTHGIPARKSDYFSGVRVDRNLRLSLTFRNILLT